MRFRVFENTMRLRTRDALLTPLRLLTNATRAELDQYFRGRDKGDMGKIWDGNFPASELVPLLASLSNDARDEVLEKLNSTTTPEERAARESNEKYGIYDSDPASINAANKRFWADRLGRKTADVAGLGVSTHATPQSVNAANRAFWNTIQANQPATRKWGQG
jgi:hypothetical protein